MPIVTPKEDAQISAEKSKALTPEEELMMISGWGKCYRRLDRVLKKKPNVNYKDADGVTPLHRAAMSGSAEFTKKLLDAKADPNVPATADLLTPLDMVTDKIDYESARDAILNSWDAVMRLDDTCTAVRPDIKGFREVAKVLESNGGVKALAHEVKPNIKPDGSVMGGAPSELRSYDLSEDGSYTTAHHLRTGKYDVLQFVDGKLIESAYDAKTGKLM